MSGGNRLASRAAGWLSVLIITTVTESRLINDQCTYNIVSVKEALSNNSTDDGGNKGSIHPDLIPALLALILQAHGTWM